MKSRARTPDTVSALADERIPFPHTDRPTPCQDDPALFAFEEVADRTQRTKTIARAKLACSGCPIVQGCLKWALANPSLTRTGVWAATTPGKRGALRQGLLQRFGDDWAGVVAAQDRRREQRQTARTVPPTVPGADARPPGTGTHPHPAAALQAVACTAQSYGRKTFLELFDPTRPRDRACLEAFKRELDMPWALYHVRRLFLLSEDGRRRPALEKPAAEAYDVPGATRPPGYAPMCRWLAHSAGTRG
ncbi:WhiB family transcriptional regulator [Streptomyces sp. LUP47B]|uniref:WhiB family transcriptional regulator n=1 Tax=Streptomyces sp. LUP47B TaxID=1890286 RepID=UPI00210C162B|nr:WhiB family transcriptional regulator [Streptomyces sp. LUP47B]